MGWGEFRLDRKAVLDRLGGAGAMDVSLKDGKVVVKGLLDWMDRMRS